MNENIDKLEPHTPTSVYYRAGNRRKKTKLRSFTPSHITQARLDAAARRRKPRRQPK
jgi:hypothetical protein